MGEHGTARGLWRVELHLGTSVEVVARLPLAPPHHAALTAVAAGLQRAGRGEGVLVLVDEHSGGAVARRRLEVPVRPWRRGAALPPRRPLPRRLGGPPPEAPAR